MNPPEVLPSSARRIIGVRFFVDDDIDVDFGLLEGGGGATDFFGGLETVAMVLKVLNEL